MQFPSPLEIYYWLQDIQLLDEGGQPYNPSLSEAPNVPQASSSRSDPGRQDVRLLDKSLHTAGPGFSDAHVNLSSK
jgi:hypothetical protein